LCGFLEREPREDPTLDNAMGALVSLGETLERDMSAARRVLGIRPVAR
jgi:hypothetical protein